MSLTSAPPSVFSSTSSIRPGSKANLSCLNVADVWGADGYSGLAHGGSFRGGPDLYPHQDQGPNPAPEIGFTPAPDSGPSGAPPTTNFNNIHIPPGAHAPANTPAELAPPTGRDPGPDPVSSGHPRWEKVLNSNRLYIDDMLTFDPM